MLPELSTGDWLVTPAGARCMARLVRRPRRDTGLDEPLYRLDHGRIVGRREWTLEELNAAGLALAADATQPQDGGAAK